MRGLEFNGEFHASCVHHPAGRACHRDWAWSVPLAAQEDGTRLLRDPDISDSHLVFVYAGDLWLAGRDGSNPRRLTSHPAEENSPIFSPDGSRIAFAAEYDGNTDVYVISVDGGQPQRLTWHPTADFRSTGRPTAARWRSPPTAKPTTAAPASSTTPASKAACRPGRWKRASSAAPMTQPPNAWPTSITVRATTACSAARPAGRATAAAPRRRSACWTSKTRPSSTCPATASPISTSSGWTGRSISFRTVKTRTSTCSASIRTLTASTS